MEDFFKIVEKFSSKIIQAEELRKEIGKILREINSKEKTIFLKVPKENKFKVIAGVDGGLVKQSLHGMDLMLVRAVGVIFFYNKNLEKVEYYPQAFPTPLPQVFFDPFSEIEFELNSNFERQATEVGIGKEVIEKFKPEVLLLHGSIVPHYAERPSKTSLIFPSYSRMIENYRKLFLTAEKHRVNLVGVVEDSRGTIFCETILREFGDKFSPRMRVILENTRDTNLLTYALEVNERTLELPYSQQPSSHPILKEFEEFSSRIFTTYLRTAEFDRPIRVDFLKTENFDIEKVCSTLSFLTTSSTYGMPSILVEADQRTELSSKDIEFFYSELASKIGISPTLFLKRRESRPF